MRTPDEARQLVRDLSLSTWQLAVISTAAETGLFVALAQPRDTASLATASGLPAAIVEALLDVLRVMGLVDRRDGVWALDAAAAAFFTSEALLYDTRSTRGQSRHLVEAARRRELSPGWSFTDPEILEAQGRSAGGSADGPFRKLVEAIGNLAPRLKDGGAFLDVGAGVGAFLVDLCKAFPTAHGVGLEPAAAPLALARRNIAAAGLEGRAEVRGIVVQDLEDRDVFDVAWVPQPFLPPDVYPVALRTVLRALRPGGWLLTIVGADDGPELAVTMMRLRLTLWGGGSLSPDACIALLSETGYANARRVPMPPGVPVASILAQKPA